MQLLNQVTGQVIVGRCKATNRCPRCQRRFVRETVEMLLIDASEWAPTLWLVLTAREHLARSDTHAHLRQLRRSLKKRWREIQWFVQVEFQRRGALHLNLLVKGVAVEDRVELRARAASLWCRRVDAQDVGQWAGEISGADGLVKYLAKTLGHGLKSEQAPPLGWKGHRTSQTAGYLVRGAAAMRQEARESLLRKTAIAHAELAGFAGVDAEEAVDAHLALQAPQNWVAYESHLLRHPGWVAGRREAARVFS